MYLTTRRLYTTVDDRLCEGHDPEVMYLLAPAGVMLPEETAQRYHLREVDAACEADSTSSEPEAEETDAADPEPETDAEPTDTEAEAAPKQSNRKSRTAAS